MIQKHRPSWLPTWIQCRLSTWGVSDRYLMYAGAWLMSPMQRCFSDRVCQSLVTFYIIDAYLFGHVARMGHRVPAHDALRLTVDIPYESRKVNGQLEKTAGSPSERLAQQGSWGCQRSTASVYAVEIWNRYRATERNGSLGLRHDADDDEWSCQKWRVKLIQAVWNRDGSVFENHWRRV